MAFADFTHRARFTASVLLAALSTPLLGPFLAPSPACATTAIRFALDRKIDGPAAPFFVAIDKGYFKDEGLDVTIDVAPGGPLEVLNRLVTGKADMGVSDINLLIKFRDANGAPIKAVFTVFDKPPYAITARRSRGIVAPRDLQGKKLGAPATDPTFAQWPIFAKVAGIDTAKVAIEDVGFPVLEPMLAAGEVDAITGFSFTSYVDLKASGVPGDDLVLLPMADYGLALYGDTIMASPSFAEEKPDAVRAFLRAYAKALKDTVRDPALAIDALPAMARVSAGISSSSACAWRSATTSLRRRCKRTALAASIRCVSPRRSIRSRSPTASRRRTRPPRLSIGRSCRGPRSAGSTMPPRGEQNIVGSS